MKGYTEERLRLLDENSRALDMAGLRVLLKPSPSEPLPGRLDHDLLAAEAARPGFDFSAMDKLPPEERLARIRDGMGGYNVNICTEEVHAKYEALSFNGNPVGLWRYYKRGSERRPDKPALLWIHGGGWIGGSVYTVENACRYIAELADAVVFSVEYSLAPEKPYPNGLYDCFAALRHIAAKAGDYGVDAGRIVIGGDSAGGNYAAIITLLAREQGGPPLAGQILLYPCVLVDEAAPEGYRWSLDEFTMDASQRERIAWRLNLGRPVPPASNPMHTAYLNGADPADPFVSPGMAASHQALPPALLAAGEFDGLRIQTEFYAGLLQAAGVPLRCLRYGGVSHAFLDLIGLVPQAEDFCREAARFIRSL
ncbi:MAG: alpha/beta hydrolase [Clostridia bacterium]|nr:alpha/beta hydrolase [Clostridia bacterium]